MFDANCYKSGYKCKYEPVLRFVIAIKSGLAFKTKIGTNLHEKLWMPLYKYNLY